ncbi:MAG TPA: nitroreductase family deazaflavin-dependent oxidoreductase [Pseudonocardia sp.]|nr:nitroreductase family deazaflavin-dependent oxidoreductase [Pseudonocardia sp.]
MDTSKIEQIPIVKAIGLQVLHLHQAIYERTDGRIGHNVLGTPCLLLRTTGARSGVTRTSGLVYAKDGADYLVVASYGGAPKAPGWYHNLLAEPEVEIQVGTARHRATARPVVPGDTEYERLWDLVNKGNGDRYRGYQRATTRPIPVVALTPVS